MASIPKLWPYLESLEVGQATGLTIDIVSEFILNAQNLAHLIARVHHAGGIGSHSQDFAGWLREEATAYHSALHDIN